MENVESTQPASQATQQIADPRRMGRNNSGISDSDIADVMCILHPCSPAAFAIVANTAELRPQNVLQYTGFENYDDGVSNSRLQEEETFILGIDGPTHAMDLALRFSVLPINPALGFVFGRNDKMCDIVLAGDTSKRVSNMHFSIFVNESGVLMLRDMSTNGTIVDDVVLKGKSANAVQTRMLNPGSIIQILSPKSNEIVKFIVRIPSREGHVEEHQIRFAEYIRQAAIARERAMRDGAGGRRGGTGQRPKPTGRQEITQPYAPLVHNQYGMHWSGGDKYNVVGFIGKGAFATVYQLATKDEGQLFAAKELEKRRFIKNGVLDRKLDNEMKIMRDISHQNIVQYVDYKDHTNHLYIIMEFVPGGDLAQYLSIHKSLTESLGNAMAIQILDALSYLHAKKITHRDIKPDNILIADMNPNNFRVKLSDFGLSKMVNNESFLKTFCGTLLYCAPEVFPHYDDHIAARGQKRGRRGTAPKSIKFHSYSQSVDIWSLGAVLWYSLCNKPPFEGVADRDGRGMFDKIMMTPLDSTDLIEKGISDDGVSLLAEMLNTDPGTRPSPAECLAHPWFGRKQLASQAPPSDAGLGAIVEEEEEDHDGVCAPNVAALRIEEHEDSGESQYDEVSIHSGSMNFFDPRQSKRFKPDAAAYRETSQILASSPLAEFESIQIGHQVEGTTQQGPPRRKLFGEISQSQLQGPGGLGMCEVNPYDGDVSNPTSESIHNGQQDQDGWSQEAQHRTARRLEAHSSLEGAEALLRDVHMESLHVSSDSHGADSSEPKTPNPPEAPSSHQTTSRTSATPNGHNDVTPKPAQPGAFSRRIHFPLSASFFYDPKDPTTHNLEYASAVSGYDFLSNPGSDTSKNASLAPTQPGSRTDDDTNQGDTDAEPENGPSATQPAQDKFVKPPPRLGKLSTTAESIAVVNLNLSQRATSWGRAPSNTYVWPDREDTRIPKRGFTLLFHAPGIDAVPGDADLTKLPGLHCIITTDSSRGIFVNDVLLPKGEPGKFAFGRLHSGDEIVVWEKGSSSSKEILKFTCEFFHGQSKELRKETGPRFKVDYEIYDEQLSGKKEEQGHVTTETASDVRQQ
ncbi:Hypothetical protein R9X50_00305900 [Acrodontium crateriforme]|uniref:non-specific serine/threonine protein kinase n=1 Tax=Acrodontium crateriforme TaxID=150365 RepID=A0AAQ3M5I0_9PEZI|nr:Hypothetical protein R9X50_00305900 [Acrodontium crateriforme]